MISTERSWGLGDRWRKVRGRKLLLPRQRCHVHDSGGLGARGDERAVVQVDGGERRDGCEGHGTQRAGRHAQRGIPEGRRGAAACVHASASAPLRDQPNDGKKKRSERTQLPPPRRKPRHVHPLILARRTLHIDHAPQAPLRKPIIVAKQQDVRARGPPVRYDRAVPLHLHRLASTSTIDAAMLAREAQVREHGIAARGPAAYGGGGEAVAAGGVEAAVTGVAGVAVDLGLGVVSAGGGLVVGLDFEEFVFGGVEVVAGNGGGHCEGGVVFGGRGWVDRW